MDRIYSFGCKSFMADSNGTRRHYTKLPGSTASYGDSIQTSTFENHANLANWPLYTPKNGFQGGIKCQGGAFLGFAHIFSVLIVWKKLPEWAPTKTRLNYSRPSTAFLYCKRRKAGRAWERGYNSGELLRKNHLLCTVIQPPCCIVNAGAPVASHK